ncbi:MAG: M20/M25/M40 family metallo-hydrolase, partial [Flavihumibacter sp.]
IPNIASDTANIRRNAAFIMEMMKRRGIGQVQLLEANERSTPPAIYGEVITPGAKQTVVFYAHYDGQPVNPAQWANGLQPFQPALYTAPIPEGGQPLNDPSANAAFDPQSRLYGRSASDDKAGVSAILFAWEAISSAKLKVPMNIKFFFEGEEEAGSPHLGEILDKHKALLQSDGWIICDGPVHQSGRKLIAYGVRGDAHVELTVYGPKRPLHSGHYGNWAPNPAMELSKLLAGMKDDKGRVTIAGFYDDVTPLTETEKKALAAVPPVEAQMKKELGFTQEEMPGSSLMEAINLPSLNINGMNSANVGKWLQT